MLMAEGGWRIQPLHCDLEPLPGASLPWTHLPTAVARSRPHAPRTSLCRAMLRPLGSCTMATKPTPNPARAAASPGRVFTLSPTPSVGAR